MDISQATKMLQSYGVDAREIDELEEQASKIIRRKMSLKMTGLTAEQSLVLVSRQLRQIASHLGIRFNHPDVIETAGFAVKQAKSKRRKRNQTEAETTRSKGVDDVA